MTNKEYYWHELKQLSNDDIKLKFTSIDGDTRRLNVNQESADAIIEYLTHRKANNPILQPNE